MENKSFNTHESFSTLLRTAVSFELLLCADYYKKIHVLLTKLRKTLIEDFQYKGLKETETETETETKMEKACHDRWNL